MQSAPEPQIPQRLFQASLLAWRASYKDGKKAQQNTAEAPATKAARQRFTARR